MKEGRSETQRENGEWERYRRVFSKNREEQGETKD